MRKLIYFIVAIGLISSLCVVPCSAASYDLGTPFELHYTTPSGANESSWPFAYNGYIYDSTSDSLVFRTSSLGERNYFGYFKNFVELTTGSPYFEFGSKFHNSELARHITVTGYDLNSPTIRYENSGDLVNSLVFASFVYENLYLPSTGQYLQVSFSVDTALIQAPTAVLDFLNLNTLCFLCDTSGRSGYPDRYSLPKVYPSTSTVKKVGNIFTYTFFFNINYTHLEPLYDSENICLALRIPYFFNSAASFSGGCGVTSNASIPLSYDILTVGGYDQALEDIKDSLDTLKNDLVDFYTDQSPADVGFISGFNSNVDNLGGVVDDYKSHQDKIDSIIDDVTLPSAVDAVSNVANVGVSLGGSSFSGNSNFWNNHIVAMVTLSFSFAMFSLILFGVKKKG